MDFFSSKNIAILTTSYLPVQGGVQYLLYWLLKEIDKNYQSYRKQFNINQIYFIVPKYKNSNFDHFKNIKVIYINAVNNKLYFLKNIVYLQRVFRKNNISLIHTHNALMDGVLCLLSTLFSKRKYIITSHGVDFSYKKEFKFGARLSWKNNQIIKLVSNRASKITTVSKDMCEFVYELVPKKKVYKIENCYDNNVKHFEKNVIKRNIKKIKSKHNIRNGDVVFLTLSGARKIKGHVNMILAFSKAIRKTPNLKLFIAAHGEETDKLKKMASDLGLSNNIFFIGFITGVTKLSFFTIADAYVNTAFFEPFGLVYLEAIQNNMAVLGSIYGGGKDIFKHLHNAYLSDPYKVSTIEDGFVYLSKKENKEKLLKNSQSTLGKYSVDNILNKYFTLYKKIMDEM